MQTYFHDLIDNKIILNRAQKQAKWKDTIGEYREQKKDIPRPQILELDCKKSRFNLNTNFKEWLKF